MSYNTIIMVWISVKFLRTQMSIYPNLPKTNNLRSFPQHNRHDSPPFSSLSTLINYFTSKFHQKHIHLFQVATTDMLHLEVSYWKTEHLSIPYILLTSRDCMYICIAHIHYLCPCTRTRAIVQQVDFKRNLHSVSDVTVLTLIPHCSQKNLLS